MTIPPITLVLVLFFGNSFGQKVSVPGFEDYPVPRRFTGTPAAPVLTHPRARLFRTMIKTQAQKGPNFAGHYTVAVWGCGSGCRGFAIIDARSGKVYFHPKAVNVSSPPYLDEDNLQFRLDSRLFIIAGSVEESGGTQSEGRFYYEWKNNTFRLIRKTSLPVPGQK